MARDFEDHCWKDIVDQETLEIYEPYRRELRVGKNPAVLAIDLYNKAYQGGPRPVREANAEAALQAARRIDKQVTAAQIAPTRLDLVVLYAPSGPSSRHFRIVRLSTDGWVP